MTLAVIPAVFILLKPTVLEFLLVMAVDMVAFLVNRKLERKFFLKLYPDAATYFDGLEDAAVEKMDRKRRIALIESFARFPARRAKFLYFESVLKVFPAVCVVVFVWEHPEASNWEQFLKIYCINLLNFCYFYGAVFIESHIFLSEEISRLHQRFDFTEVFSRVKIPYRRQDFERQEILVMTFIIFFMVTLQIVSVVSHYEETPARLATEVGTVGLIAIALFCRIWYLRRQFFVGGLEHLFQQLAHVGYKQPPPTLAMHTSPLLAQFETAYNQLVRRLATSERELSTMVSRETDKGRMLAVGEMSALIAHNLSGPLHAAKFCVAELIADPEHEKKDAYLERMRGNMDRATELLTSLMASLKNPGDDLGYASFETAHHHVVTLLALQFKKSDFMQVRFPLDPALHSVRVSMPQIDLIHILDNLYRNSIEDFLRHRASLRLAECTIEVSLVAESADAVEISIRDYGSGLTPERFEQLTNSQARIGLGLRLTRRLVELAGGTLEAMDPTGLPGSHFNLRLPRAAAEKPGMRVETPTTSTRLEEFV